MKQIISNPTQSQEKLLRSVQESGLYAELAYHQPDSEEFKRLLVEIKDHGGVNHLTKIVPFYKTESKDPEELAGVVASTEGKLIVAYHGTSNIDEVFSDFNISHFTMKLPCGLEAPVHDGCYSIYQESYDDSQRAMNEASDGNEYNEVIYTGHSLGAGLATIAALDKKGANPKFSISTIIFGSGQFISHEAAKTYETLGLSNNTINIQQVGDPVTILPPKRFDFTHVGHIIKIPTSMDSGIHLMSTAYKEITMGKYKDKTTISLSKLDKPLVAEAYKPFEMSGYNKSIILIAPLLLKKLPGKHRIIVSAVASGAIEGLNAIQQIRAKKINQFTR